MCFFQYKTMEGSFEEIARDYCPNWMTAVEVHQRYFLRHHSNLPQFRFWTMTHFWEPRTTTTCLSVKEMLAQTQTRRGNRCRRFRTLLTYSSFVMNSFKGGSDPHWGHGECVPARQPGDAEPGRQHHPPHRLRPLWHSQRLNRAGHPVAPGDLFNVGCTLYAPLWLHFIFFFGLHSSTAGVL